MITFQHSIPACPAYRQAGGRQGMLECCSPKNRHCRHCSDFLLEYIYEQRIQLVFEFNKTVMGAAKLAFWASVDGALRDYRG